MKYKSMIVKDLIQALTEAPQDMLVITEGCDCDGDVGAVEVRDGDVYLHRSR